MSIVAPSGLVRGWRRRLAELGPAYGAPAALALLVLVNVLLTPRFATAANFWNILLQVATTVIVAVGMALVMAGGGIDLSVGSIMAVASAVAALLIERGPAVAAGAGLGAAVGLGSMNGLLVTRGRVDPFIASLALLISGRGLAQVLCNEGEILPFSNPPFESIGRGRVGPVPVPVLLATGVVVVAVFVVRAASFGRYLLATGGNEAAARLAGVPIDRTRLATYVASGLLAGLAGLIETARLGATDPSNVGAGMEFAAIAAVVIGGTPFGGGRLTVGGTVVGALVMVVIAASLNMLLVSYAWTLLIQAGIILLAVYVQRPNVV